MTQKIAVAVVHGIGRQAPEFADKLKVTLQKLCHATCGEDVIIQPVYWARAMQEKEDALWDRVIAAGPMQFRELRRLMIDYVADALAYQPTAFDRKAYDDIHVEYAKTLRTLAQEAGPEAPLCIVSHSLGTVITSNFVYDLQKPELISDQVRVEMTDTALERGETLNLLYTLGSPLALWSLRFREFGRPIQIPSPQLLNHYPDLQSAWINYYDKDDLVGFPLRDLNPAYSRAVSADREVNVGNFLTEWNPLSHIGYLHDNDVIKPIAESLINTWKTVNPEAVEA
ncbi:MAG: chemotaxis protein [Anaerolineaceae bacterium]|nr:chemotaxis protein [Anaerolineaceae bacterium]